MSKKRRAKIPPFRVLNSENIFRKFVSKIMRSCDKNFAQLQKELGKQCGLPVDSKTLIRVVDTLPQKTLSDRERKNNLKKALKIGVDGVQWKRVLVVDDIYTTGSTVDAAAAVLREVGVEKIYILSITIGNGYQKEELEWM